MNTSRKSSCVETRFYKRLYRRLQQHLERKNRNLPKKQQFQNDLCHKNYFAIKTLFTTLLILHPEVNERVRT